MNPSLWRAHGPEQVYITSLLTNVLGEGPGRDCDSRYTGLRPLQRLVWRKARHPTLAGRERNAAEHHGRTACAPQRRIRCAGDCGAAVRLRLRHPGATRLRRAILGRTRTTSAALATHKGPPRSATRAADLGARLLGLHTYGERYGGSVPQGEARCEKAVSLERYPEKHAYNPMTRVLHVGDGEFAPVSREVWDYSISGMQVVKSWLDRRKREPSGKKSSPLDDITPRALGVHGGTPGVAVGLGGDAALAAGGRGAPGGGVRRAALHGGRVARAYALPNASLPRCPRWKRNYSSRSEPPPTRLRLTTARRAPTLAVRQHAGGRAYAFGRSLGRQRQRQGDRPAHDGHAGNSSAWRPNSSSPRRTATPTRCAPTSKRRPRAAWRCSSRRRAARRRSPASSPPFTTLPVIGVPLASSELGGVDALYSVVQMPPGIPVATVAVGSWGARNAAILADADTGA